VLTDRRHSPPVMVDMTLIRARVDGDVPESRWDRRDLRRLR
jgi:hypothetical protein